MAPHNTVWGLSHFQPLDESFPVQYEKPNERELPYGLGRCKGWVSQCRSTDDNYYCFGLAEEVGATPHQPACHVPRCSTLPPSQALTHVRQERAPRSASPAGIIRFPHAFSSTHCISLHIMPVGQRWLAASQAAQGRQWAGLPGNGKADMPTVVSTAIPGLDMEANFRLMATIQGRCCSPSTFQTQNVWIGNAMENNTFCLTWF